MRFFIFLPLMLAAFACSNHPAAQHGNQKSYIVHARSGKTFMIVSAGKTVPLYVSSFDHEGVIRATRDLQEDIIKVSGTPVEVVVYPGEMGVISHHRHSRSFPWC